MALASNHRAHLFHPFGLTFGHLHRHIVETNPFAHRRFDHRVAASHRKVAHSIAMDGSGDARSYLQKAWDAVQEVPGWIVSKAKPTFHYGFIPFIIVVGMNTEPKPTWSQLLGPM